MLDHLGGLNRHPDQVVAELVQQRLEHGARVLDRGRRRRCGRGFGRPRWPAKPQVFRRAGEGDGPAAGLTRECLLQVPRPIRQEAAPRRAPPRRPSSAETAFLSAAARRRHPHGPPRRRACRGRPRRHPRPRRQCNVGAEGEGAGSETGPDQFGKARLVERRLALRQSRDPLLIEIDRNRGNPGRGRAGGGHRAEMPQAEDRELHVVLLEDPAILRKPVDGPQHALADGELRLPAERANASRVQQDERAVADPSALAARIGQLRAQRRAAPRSSRSSR